MTWRAVLFDFNGVLLDDEPVHCELLRKTLAGEGIELTREAYYETYLGLDDEGVLVAAFRDAGREPEPDRIRRLIEKKAHVYLERMERDGYPFFPNALETLGWCLDRFPVAIVSGALRAEIETALGQARLRGRLVAIVAAEDAASKPDPEGYRLGLEELRRHVTGALSAREVLAVEDSPAGIRAARGAGVSVLAVAQTYGPEALGEADAVVERVEDVRGVLEKGSPRSPVAGPRQRGESERGRQSSDPGS